MKCGIMLYFVWVFTVCQSASLGFSSIQIVKFVLLLKASNDNQATTTLAFHSNETTKDECAVNDIKLAIYYCHSGACQTTQRRVHFYRLITLKHKKVVEKFVKNLFYGEKRSFIEWTYSVGAHWNCLYECNMLLYGKGNLF